MCMHHNNFLFSEKINNIRTIRFQMKSHRFIALEANAENVRWRIIVSNFGDSLEKSKMAQS